MPKLTADDQRDALALFILRLGLIWFLFLWAIHKVITPGQYQQLAQHFDDVDLSLVQVYGIAGAQLLLLGLALIGIFRPFNYGAMAVMHLFTVLRRWERFIDPFAINDKGFPINRNPVIDLAVLGAMIALVLLIHRDHFSLGGWLKRHWDDKWWL
ncbi:MAG: hypothetical protein AAGF22_05660 [Pseudomonadota bacterium]